MSGHTAELQNALDQLDAAVESKSISHSAAENLRRWLVEPQYREYLDQLLSMVAAGDWERLDGLFWEVVDFGTGGRRGRMDELGSATINSRTIAESAHGIAAYWKQFSGKDSGRAVISCDTRNRSLEFSKLTAEVFAGHGFHVFFFPTHRSTPELSFAVRHLNCDIGAMISASHNPPSDNGFKAYWNHGGQVLAPHDRGIIQCVFEAAEIPRVPFDEAVEKGTIEIVGDDVDQAYCDEVAALTLSLSREMPAIFTPLHGVGTTSVYRILQQVGFVDVELFGPQAEPDGNFTNVPDQLPNPERPEVFSPAIERARESGAELILASDPDADRIAVVVRTADGQFVPLTGNQAGVLLVDYVIGKRQKRGDLTDQHYVVETMVTTPMIGRITRAAGLRVVDDLLVGFKFIGQTMDELGPELFVFGTEESLGYLAGSYCRDKDAAVAALYLMELAAELRKDGKTLVDRLDELYVAHSYYLESQRSKVCTGPSGRQQIDRIMQAFREQPPESLAGLKLERVRDYGQHEIRSLPANSRTDDLPEPQGNLLMFESESSSCAIQFAARPSGTEPKIKFYFFARADVPSADDLPHIKDSTRTRLDQAADDLMAWIDQLLDSV